MLSTSLPIVSFFVWECITHTQTHSHTHTHTPRHSLTPTRCRSKSQLIRQLFGKHKVTAFQNSFKGFKINSSHFSSAKTSIRELDEILQSYKNWSDWKLQFIFRSCLRSFKLKVNCFEEVHLDSERQKSFPIKYFNISVLKRLRYIDECSSGQRQGCVRTMISFYYLRQKFYIKAYYTVDNKSGL